MITKLSTVAIAAAALALSVACGSPTKGGAPSANRPVAKSDAAPASVEEGKALYKTNCVACHGESGKGDGPAAGVLKPPPRDHTDYAYMSTLTDEDIARTIKLGGAPKGKPLMPSHPQLKDPQLKALVAYVRSLSAPAQ